MYQHSFCQKTAYAHKMITAIYNMQSHLCVTLLVSAWLLNVSLCQVNASHSVLTKNVTRRSCVFGDERENEIIPRSHMQSCMNGKRTRQKCAMYVHVLYVYIWVTCLLLCIFRSVFCWLWRKFGPIAIINLNLIILRMLLSFFFFHWF